MASLGLIGRMAAGLFLGAMLTASPAAQPAPSPAHPAGPVQNPQPTAPAPSPGAPQASPLSRLEPGLWELRDPRHSELPVRSLCLGDAQLLVQIQHGDAPCTRTLLSASQDEATVHYVCRSAGFGDTVIHFDGTQSVRIDSQGIYQSVPFGLHAEARRVGSCGGGGAHLRR